MMLCLIKDHLLCDRQIAHISGLIRTSIQLSHHLWMRTARGLQWSEPQILLNRIEIGNYFSSLFHLTFFFFSKVPNYHSITVQKGNIGFWWTARISIPNLGQYHTVLIIIVTCSLAPFMLANGYHDSKCPHTLLSSCLLLHYKLPPNSVAYTTNLQIKMAEQKGDVTETLNELILPRNILW